MYKIRITLTQCSFYQWHAAALLRLTYLRFRLHKKNMNLVSLSRIELNSEYEVWEPTNTRHQEQEEA